MYILYQKVAKEAMDWKQVCWTDRERKKTKDNKNSRDYTLSLNLARSLLLLLSFCIPKKNKVFYFFILLLPFLSIHSYTNYYYWRIYFFYFCILKPYSLLYKLLLLRLFFLVLISLVWVYSFSFLFFKPFPRRKAEILFPTHFLLFFLSPFLVQSTFLHFTLPY